MIDLAGQSLRTAVLSGFAAPIRVAHVITGLQTGGAEVTLLRLLSAMNRTRFQNFVIALSGEGPVAARIRDLGVPVTILNLRRRPLQGVRDLTLKLRRIHPAVVQTWLHQSDLLGGLASLAAPGAQLVWNIRNGWLNRQTEPKRGVLWASRGCARLSHWLPARIICCSAAACDAHVLRGYPKDKFVVIPNGFDTDVFRPDPHVYVSIRRELGVPADTPLIGLVARLHPSKDHAGFLKAAAVVRRTAPKAHFVLCGDGIAPGDSWLMKHVAQSGLGSRCHLLGRRDDIARIMAGLDLLVSSSLAEAFPNVIGEAMACGVPCVATDVGDSRLIVGECGYVVAPADPHALAAAITTLIQMNSQCRAKLGIEARARIVQQFSLTAMAHRYEQVYRAMAEQCAG